MPAIVDPDGPGGKPISVFESGAILQYLGRKTGKFYPADERARVEVDEWLFWQMGGLGPMAGQAHHFRNYAPEKIKYGIDRYTNEVNRLYGVMNKRLADRDYLAGAYSIADMASYPWVRPYKNQGQDLAEFPHLERWFQRMRERPAVAKAVKIGEELRDELQSRRPTRKRRRCCSGKELDSFAAVRNAFAPEARLRRDGYCGRGSYPSRSHPHLAAFGRYSSSGFQVSEGGRCPGGCPSRLGCGAKAPPAQRPSPTGAPCHHLNTPSAPRVRGTCRRRDRRPGLGVGIGRTRRGPIRAAGARSRS